MEPISEEISAKRRWTGREDEAMSDRPRVLIIMGSDSDMPVMVETKRTLDSLGIPSRMTVASAHRTPGRAVQLAKQASGEGIQVIIAGAGAAAHLAAVIAAQTILPVIGVPIDSSPLSGWDALLSTVQMPPGVPVATMAVGKSGARNAGILAAQILGLQDAGIQKRIQRARNEQMRTIEEKAAKVEEGKYD
jgi:phosphoribosylaminoimidazole carboxylase PurE protein